DQAPVLFGQVLPRCIEGNAAPSREPPQLRLRGLVVRLVPGLDRALAQSAVLVRDHEVLVHLDEVAEAMAGRAGAVGVVEGEEARLRLLEPAPAASAVEPLREPELGAPDHAHESPSAAL